MTKVSLEESGRILYSKAVIADLKQLTKLVALNLSVETISERMAMKEKDVKHIIKILGVKNANSN